MRFVIAIFLCLNFVRLNAQTPMDSTKTGKYLIRKDAKIDSLIAKSIELRCKPVSDSTSADEFCRQNPRIWGYRIQVYHGKDRKNWEKMYADLKINFPKEAVLQEYTYPYYRVFIGQYKDKETALADVKKYRRIFPNALAAQWYVRCTDVMSQE